MKITVLYFASLREAVGVSKEVIELPLEVKSLHELVTYLGQRGQEWHDALRIDKGLRSALNQDIVSLDALLVEGAEVAFFPPVTGG